MNCGRLRKGALAALTLAMFVMAATPALAVPLTWDPGTGGATDGAGDWLGTGEWWTGSANVDWSNVNPDDATIGNGGTGDTITLGTVSAGTVLLDNFSGTYTLDGGSLDQGGGITVGATAGNVTINSDVSGAGSITMNGSGTLTLSGTNTYNGGTVIGGGTVRVTADNNLGAADTAITFDGSATLYNEQGGNTTIDLGARPITLNNGAIATFRLGRGDGFTTTGAVTGDGGVAIQVSGGNSPKIYLLSTNNTFTGPVEIRSGSDRPYVTVNSLADSSGAITLNNGGGHFVYASGATGPLTLNNRPIVVEGGGSIDNLSSDPMTINSSVTGSGTGNGTFGLSGGQGGTVNADIDEGTRTLGLSVSGSWSLAGTNTYSGTTSINSGTLTIRGTQAMSTNSKIYMKRSTTISLLTDDAGTVNFGNEIELSAIDTSSGVTTNYTIHVGNNGGATTGSTIALGKVDFSKGDLRSGRQINVTGANGYSVQVGDVVLATEIRGTATGGAQRIRGNSAPLEITGTVRQIDGGSGNHANAYNLYLGGTGTDNLVSGTIMNASDYDDLSNLNTLPLNVYKGESGEWTLSGDNAYTGVTTVSGGTLLVNGTHTGGGAYTVTSGALGGTGTITPAATNLVVVQSGGAIAPGTSAGTLTIGGDGLQLDAGSTYEIEGGDLVDVIGDLDVPAATVTLKLLDEGIAKGGTLTIFNYGTFDTGETANFTIDAQELIDGGVLDGSEVLTVVDDIANDLIYINGVSSASATITDINNDGIVDDMDLNLMLSGAYTQTDLDALLADFGGVGTPPPGPSTVPEPGSLALFALGALGLVSVVRRRRR